MVQSTPHLIVGPLTEAGARAAERAASDQFGPVESELARNGPDRVWLLLRWAKRTMDRDAQQKVLGFCHGAAWAQDH